MSTRADFSVAARRGAPLRAFGLLFRQLLPRAASDLPAARVSGRGQGVGGWSSA